MARHWYCPIPPDWSELKESVVDLLCDNAMVM